MQFDGGGLASDKSKRWAKLRDIYRSIDQERPVVASTLSGWHWTCVYGYSNGHVYVADPSALINVRVRVSAAEFRSQWDRAMLEIRKAT